MVPDYYEKQDEKQGVSGDMDDCTMGSLYSGTLLGGGESIP